MKKYGILFIIVVFGLVLTIAGCRQTPAEPALAQEQPVTGIDISQLDTQDVGQEVVTGDIIWEITEVEDLGTQLTYEGHPGFLEPEVGKFISITFLIQNTGEEGKTFFDLTAIDDRGRTYSICLAAFAFFSPEEACVMQEIIPGVENTYTAVFDIEADANQLVLQVTDLNLPPQELAYIDLDL